MAQKIWGWLRVEVTTNVHCYCNSACACVSPYNTALITSVSLLPRSGDSAQSYTLSPAASATFPSFCPIHPACHRPHREASPPCGSPIKSGSQLVGASLSSWTYEDHGPGSGVPSCSPFLGCSFRVLSALPPLTHCKC
jgi:hypothetical protein